MDRTSISAVVTSGLVILTTGWAQDFQDQDGDRLQGNITIPIALPRLARSILLASLVIWSIALSVVWQHSPEIAFTLLALGSIVGGRYWLLRSTKDDQTSFALYNVSSLFDDSTTLGLRIRQIWLSFVHLLPLFSRFATRRSPGGIHIHG